MRQVAGRLRLDLAQYRELAAFAQFGSELDKATQAQLNRGARMVEILKQDQFVPLPVERQILIIFAGVNGHVDDLPIEAMRPFEQGLSRFVEASYPEIYKELNEKNVIGEDLSQKMEQAIREHKEEFKAQKPAA
jgi:F-type H+-transporting ATPase subunit alpha